MGTGGQLGGYAGKSKVNFGGLMTPRDRFATRDMVRELSQSPLIEIGSHTGPRITAFRPTRREAVNPPSLTVFDNATGHYETDEHFNQRIAADVRKVTDKITR